MLSRSKLHFLVFIFSFLILTRFNIDPDLGWHLAYGREFLANGEIIRVDRFSWTMAGYDWANSYFLYQIFLAFLFEHFQLASIAIIFGLIAASTLWLLLPKKVNLAGALLAIFGVGLTLTNLAIRPHVFDFLLFSMLLFFLSRGWHLKTRFLPLWFVFFAFWANLHLGFVVGLLVLGLFLFFNFLEKLSTGGRLVRKSIFGAMVMMAAFLGTFLTPFHFKMWQSIFFESGGSVAWFSIAEFLPVAIFVPVNILYAVSGLIFAFVFFRQYKSLKLVWFWVAALLFMLPFLTSFFVLFWAAIFIFISTRYIRFELDLKASFWSKLPLWTSVVAAAMAIFFNFLINIWESATLEQRLAKDLYPARATLFLKENDISDNLFNLYHWGGYLEWQVPQIPVFIDGRMAGWKKADGKYILADYLAILKGDCEVARRWQIKTVLVEAERNNPCFGDFREVYRDSEAKILRKD